MQSDPSDKAPALHVLSVSYDKELSHLRAMVLRHAGFAVYVADTKEAAMEHLRAERLDLMLLGHTLPIADCKELIAVCRKRSPSTKIALLTHPAKARDTDTVDAYIESTDGPKALVEQLRDLAKR
jgi:DNA-binding response OmpR family regulator